MRKAGSATGFVVTKNVTLDVLGMRTKAGTVATAGLLLERRRMRWWARRDRPVRLTVPIVGVPPVTLDGETVTEARDAAPTVAGKPTRSEMHVRMP